MSDITEAARAEARRAYPTGRTIRLSDVTSAEGRGLSLELARAGYEKGYEAGWAAAREPRTVTTAEELDTLPVGSVVLDSDGDAWQYVGMTAEHPVSIWSSASGSTRYTTRWADGTTLTVLCEPKGENRG